MIYMLTNNYNCVSINSWLKSQERIDRDAHIAKKGVEYHVQTNN